jgi:hypothetical protein
MCKYIDTLMSDVDTQPESSYQNVLREWKVNI